MAPPANSVLSTTVALIGLQVASRLFSFGLNQLLLRSTTPQAFGLATIQFDTLIGTVLFLLREGLRGAVARIRPSASPSSRLLFSQTLLLPTLLSPLATAAFALYHLLSTPSPSPPFFRTTLLLYFLSTLIELIYEPLYLRTLQAWETLTPRRVKVEGLATLGKAFATLAVVKAVRSEDALLAFGVGQLVHSATIWAGLTRIIRSASTKEAKDDALQSASVFSLEKIAVEREGKEDGKATAKDERYFNPQVTRLGWALTKQSFVKQLLTEGDKLAVGRFGSGEDMGGYAVALNYGSLIARIVFQPLEESSRLYFSSLSSATSPFPDAADTARSTLPSPARKPSLPALLSLATHLRLLLLLHTHLTLIFFLLAPSYTTPLLHLLLGARWSLPAGPILRAYVLSLPIMGLNGSTEAFFQSLASPAWIARGSSWMAVCAVAFAGATAGLCGAAGLGARGLVGANCVNLALRTGFSTVFIRRYFGLALDAVPDEAASAEVKGEKRAVRAQLAWKSWTPDVPTVVAFALAGWVVRASEAGWTERAMGGKAEGRWEVVKATGRHVGVGAVAGIGCLLVVALTRRHELKALLSSAKPKTA
ncbi:hypothetical protein JCM10207_001628 [Rhodosporidiobolus poonsookiae]